MMDDLLNHYIALEKIYINHALADGFRKDKQNFITVVHKETDIERKLAEGQIDEKHAQVEREEITEDEELNHDLMDDFCLILDKSTKRVSKKTRLLCLIQFLLRLFQLCLSSIHVPS